MTASVSTAFLISNWQRFLQHLHAGDFSSGDVVYSGSPGVSVAVGSDAPGLIVRDSEILISTHEANELGRAAFDIVGRWQDALNGATIGDLPALPWGDILARGPYHLVVGLAYHALEIQRVCDEVGALSVPVAADGGAPIGALAPISMNYHDLLADSDFRPAGVTFHRQCKIDRPSGDYLPGLNVERREKAVGAIGRRFLQLFGRRPLILGHLLQKLLFSRHRLSFPAFASNGETHQDIVLFAANEIITARYFEVLKRGARLRRINRTAPVVRQPDASVYKAVEERLTAAAECSTASGHLAPILPIAIRRIAEYFAACLVPTAEYLVTTQDPAIWPKLSGKPVLLTNGLYDPVENLTAALFRKRYGGTVICCQHGGIGLLRHYRTMMRFTDMSRSDGYLCYNAFEPDYYRRWSGRPAPQFHVAGAWNAVGAVSPRLARTVVRSVWGVGPAEPLVLYAPTRFKEGHLWFPDGVRDMDYWRTMRSVIMRGLADVPGRAIVKVHQKGLSPRGMQQFYKMRKSPLDALTLPEKVSVRGYPDLTYCRHAADIIIVDRATSTLGWAMSSDAIIIYLETPHGPLEDDVRLRLEDAVFLVDTSDPEWPEALRALVGGNLAEIRRRWDEKRGPREAFIRDYLLGPKRPGEELFDFIQRMGRRT